MLSYCNIEAFIGVSGIQDICHFTSKGIGFSLLSGILNSYENLLWGYLPVYKGYLPVCFKGYGIFGTPLYRPQHWLMG